MAVTSTVRATAGDAANATLGAPPRRRRAPRAWRYRSTKDYGTERSLRGDAGVGGAVVERFDGHTVRGSSRGEAGHEVAAFGEAAAARLVTLASQRARGRAPAARRGRPTRAVRVCKVPSGVCSVDTKRRCGGAAGMGAVRAVRRRGAKPLFFEGVRLERIPVLLSKYGLFGQPFWGPLPLPGSPRI
jgi:hypothetical protein